MSITEDLMRCMKEILQRKEELSGRNDVIFRQLQQCGQLVEDLSQLQTQATLKCESRFVEEFGQELGGTRNSYVNAQLETLSTPKSNVGQKLQLPLLQTQSLSSTLPPKRSLPNALNNFDPIDESVQQTLSWRRNSEVGAALPQRIRRRAPDPPLGLPLPSVSQSSCTKTTSKLIHHNNANYANVQNNSNAVISPTERDLSPLSCLVLPDDIFYNQKTPEQLSPMSDLSCTDVVMETCNAVMFDFNM